MNRFEIIRQPPVTRRDLPQAITIFGKDFLAEDVSAHRRILVHEDFPMIDENDLGRFIAYASKKRKAVMSGCKARIHPYRLMYITEEGWDDYLANVPQEIRGNRQSYPEVYSFVPALIAVPPNIPMTSLNHPENVHMYVMLDGKLLDRSSLIDRLTILSLKRSSAQAKNKGGRMGEDVHQAEPLF